MSEAPEIPPKWFGDAVEQAEKEPLDLETKSGADDGKDLVGFPQLSTEVEGAMVGLGALVSRVAPLSS